MEASESQSIALDLLSAWMTAPPARMLAVYARALVSFPSGIGRASVASLIETSRTRPSVAEVIERCRADMPHVDRSSDMCDVVMPHMLEGMAAVEAVRDMDPLEIQDTALADSLRRAMDAAVSRMGGMICQGCGERTRELAAWLDYVTKKPPPDYPVGAVCDACSGS